MNTQNRKGLLARGDTNSTFFFTAATLAFAGAAFSFTGQLYMLGGLLMTLGAVLIAFGIYVWQRPIRREQREATSGTPQDAPPPRI